MESWDNESFEKLLKSMQTGEDWAFDTFFKKYYDQLVQLAKKKIGSFPLRIHDEEDLALSAMNSLFNCLRENRFEAQNSIELWKILVTITNRKLINYRERQHAQKRGSGKVRGDSIWAQTGENNIFHERTCSTNRILA